MILTGLWCKQGCPEKMTVHVKSTGETIFLLNGLPVTLTAEKKPLLVPTSKAKNRRLSLPMPCHANSHCEVCKTQFQAARKTARFCSERCRQKFHREQAEERKRRETAELVSNLASCVG